MANKLVVTSQCITIKCDRGDIETAMLVAQIPYVHSNRIKTEYITSVYNIDLVLKLFRNIDVFNIETAPLFIQQIFEREMHRRIATKTLLELGPTNDDGFLWRHQQLGRELAEVNPKFAFYYDTRTGKTPMSLQIIQDDIDRNPTHKWLVLCPLILIENAWLPDAEKMFPRLRVVSLHDVSKTKRLKQFELDANLYVGNIESFIPYRAQYESLKVDGCFVDESSTMKSNSSKFGKAAVEYAYTLKRWYLLSGTPAPNGEWEYFRQLQSVDMYGVHQSYSQFKEHFFNNVSYNPQYEKLALRADRKEELLSLLKTYSLYVDKEDVLTTPGRDFFEVELIVPKDLKEKYDQLRKELYMELGENVTITSPSTAATLNKLNQVSSGFVLDTLAAKTNKANRLTNSGLPELEESYLLSEYRFEALDTLLSEIGDEQAIIWCTYRKEFEIIKQRLGDKCECVYGGVTITDKNINIKKFMNGEIQYLVANPASADKGLTLTNAHHAIYFSLGYSFELWKQSIERIYGDIIKQPHRCKYYIMLALGTVDKAIYTTVQTKGDMSSAILGHLKGGL